MLQSRSRGATLLAILLIIATSAACSADATDDGQVPRHGSGHAGDRAAEKHVSAASRATPGAMGDGLPKVTAEELARNVERRSTLTPRLRFTAAQMPNSTRHARPSGADVVRWE
jgi:hypothetical protein